MLGQRDPALAKELLAVLLQISHKNDSALARAALRCLVNVHRALERHPHYAEDRAAVRTSIGDSVARLEKLAAEGKGRKGKKKSLFKAAEKTDAADTVKHTVLVCSRLILDSAELKALATKCLPSVSTRNTGLAIQALALAEELVRSHPFQVAGFLQPLIERLKGAEGAFLDPAAAVGQVGVNVADPWVRYHVVRLAAGMLSSGVDLQEEARTLWDFLAAVAWFDPDPRLSSEAFQALFASARHCNLEGERRKDLCCQTLNHLHGQTAAASPFRAAWGGEKAGGGEAVELEAAPNLLLRLLDAAIGAADLDAPGLVFRGALRRLAAFLECLALARRAQAAAGGLACLGDPLRLRAAGVRARLTALASPSNPFVSNPFVVAPVLEALVWATDDGGAFCLDPDTLQAVVQKHKGAFGAVTCAQLLRAVERRAFELPGEAFEALKCATAVMAGCPSPEHHAQILAALERGVGGTEAMKEAVVQQALFVVNYELAVYRGSARELLIWERFQCAALRFLGENVNFCLAEYAWEAHAEAAAAAEAANTRDFLVGTAARQPLLYSTVMVLQQALACGELPKRAAAVRALGSVAVRSGEPYRWLCYRALRALDARAAAGAALLRATALAALDGMYEGAALLRQPPTEATARRLAALHGEVMGRVARLCAVPEALFLPFGPGSGPVMARVLEQFPPEEVEAQAQASAAAEGGGDGPRWESFGGAAVADAGAGAAEAAASRAYGTVLHEFRAEGPHELTVRANTVVVLHYEVDGWTYVQGRDGHGLVPTSHLAPIAAAPEAAGGGGADDAAGAA